MRETEVDIRISELLITFETSDEIFVVGVFLQHVLFQIRFARQNSWTICTMELLSVGLMSEHVRFQTVTLRKSKFTYLNQNPDSEVNASDEHPDSLCIDTDVRLESTRRDRNK